MVMGAEKLFVLAAVHHKQGAQVGRVFFAQVLYAVVTYTPTKQVLVQLQAGIIGITAYVLGYISRVFVILGKFEFYNTRYRIGYAYVQSMAGMRTLP